MEIKELREMTDLTQKEFAEHYHIPLQTLKQWESREDSSSYRKPPDHVVYLMNQLVIQEFVSRSPQKSLRVERLMDAAEESRGDMSLWFRYLRKEVDGKRRPLTEGEIRTLLASDRLTRFQKISFDRCFTPETVTNQFVRALNERARPGRLEEIMRRRSHADK